MPRIFASLLLVIFCAISFFAPLTVWAVTIDTVPVGNPGNTGDTEVVTSGTADGTSGYGSVAYNYRIGTHEVTNAQYVEFLNAKAASDPFDLYHASMGDIFQTGGITQSGSSPSFTYAVNGSRGDMPVNFVSWYDSIRFANWLNNGQGGGDTETGAYTILGGTPEPSNGLSITRNPGATWFLTSEDEWYKAAYHKNDGVTGNYFDYPTSSDTAPIAEAPAGGSNSANYGAFVLTDVGAYTASDSPYGTFDQAGNVWEWTEALIIGSSRGVRGGSIASSLINLRSSSRFVGPPPVGISTVGFRVATVPEPSTAVLAIVGMIGLALYGWRRKR